MQMAERGGRDESRMLMLLDSALSKVQFPDPDIARVAEQMAGQNDTNRVWGWLALTAVAPGTWGRRSGGRHDVRILPRCAPR